MGKNITLGYLEKYDVTAAVEWVKHESLGDRIGIVGCSLGGASALLASPLGVDAIVLESVYPTITDAVYDRVEMRLGIGKYVLAPALLCQLRPRLGISTSQLRPIDYIDDVNCPILLASGDLDEHTPIDETRTMYDAANDPKQIVVFIGAGHVDLLDYDPDTYNREILSFLNLNLLDNNIDKPAG